MVIDFMYVYFYICNENIHLVFIVKLSHVWAMGINSSHYFAGLM